MATAPCLLTEEIESLQKQHVTYIANKYGSFPFQRQLPTALDFAFPAKWNAHIQKYESVVMQVVM